MAEYHASCVAKCLKRVVSLYLTAGAISLVAVPTGRHHDTLPVQETPPFPPGTTRPRLGGGGVDRPDPPPPADAAVNRSPSRAPPWTPPPPRSRRACGHRARVSADEARARRECEPCGCRVRDQRPPRRRRPWPRHRGRLRPERRRAASAPCPQTVSARADNCG